MVIKRIYILIIGLLLFNMPVDAQKCVIDAVSHAPVAAASIFDAAGNMVGFTWSDGVFSEVPESAYPITLRCMGYEQLVIERPEEKTWEMTPITYELEEVVIIPVERNVFKPTFYVREYFSMSSKTDTITFFTEHMADCFVPTSKSAKFGGKSSMRILSSRSYAHYQLAGCDSVGVDPESMFPSMISVFDNLFEELNEKEIKSPESFKEPGNMTKFLTKPGKSGAAFVMKQNDQAFTITADGLADEKDHKISPWLLKLIGFTMEFNQLYMTLAYRVNDKGVYLPKDMIEASLVMEADGRGKYLRKALNSDTPVKIHSMIELYMVDRDYLSKDEAKAAYKNKPTHVEFVIPATVPPLNEATKRLVERANAEAKKQ